VRELCRFGDDVGSLRKPTTGVHALRWAGPWPQKVISSLDLVSTEGAPVPVPIAVTAAVLP